MSIVCHCLLPTLALSFPSDPPFTLHGDILLLVLFRKKMLPWAYFVEHVGSGLGLQLGLEVGVRVIVRIK